MKNKSFGDLPPLAADCSCDVLVVGSGAAGLATAITASELGLEVVVIEKAPKFGGTTARSGGWLWVPGNPLALDAGVIDSRGDAERYIANEAGGNFDPARVAAFLNAVKPMLEFFQARTRVRFTFGSGYPDYKPDHPGGAEQGRSIHPLPFNGAELGPMLKRLAPQMRESTFLGMGLNSGPDLKHFLNATRSAGSAAFVTRRIAEHGWNLARHGRGTRLVNGNALAARLLASALDRGITLSHSTQAVSLMQAGGRVTGAVAESQGRRFHISARRGVVLAAGGFPHDAARVRRHFAHETRDEAHASLAPAANTGDGLRIAVDAGARVIDSYGNAAAWAPVSLIRYADGSQGRFFHLIDRAKPGVIAINAQGRRFVNESINYHDFVQAMLHEAGPGRAAACWLVCDHRALRRYGMGAVRPFPLPIGSFLRNGYLLRGNTVAELAHKLSIDSATLDQTIRDFNTQAAQGMDSAFGKGATSYQRLLGDPDFKPNPCLAPLATAPYYAVRVIPGDLGTYHGLATDAATRVLDPHGKPIAGLHAVGNDAASIFGGSYPGAGATLGPAMAFGFLCAHQLAEL